MAFARLNRSRSPLQFCNTKIAISIIALGILRFPMTLYGQSRAALTLEQVQSLLKIGAPDTTIADEIGLRGVAFQMSAALLNELQSEGAGDRTLASLRKLIPAADAFLSITSNYPDTSITIDHLGTYTGFAVHVPCRAGTYELHASRFGMQPLSSTITIEAGKDQSVYLHLTPDQGYIQMLDTVPKAEGGAAKDFTPSNNGDPSLLDSDIQSARSEAAATSFLAKDWAQFGANCREALNHGEPVSIKMLEEHNGKGWTGESVRTVEITITPTNLLVQTVGAGGGTKMITAPLSTIGVIEVTDKAIVGKGIAFVVRHLTAGTYLLHVDIQKGKRESSRMQLYLATADSQVIKTPGGVAYLDSPPESVKELKAVAEAIRSVVAIRKSTE